MVRRLAVLASLALASGTAFAQNPPGEAATLVRKKGGVHLWTARTQAWTPAVEKGTIVQGAFLKTDRQSEAVVAMGKKAVITLGEGTVVKVESALFEKGEIRNVRLRIGSGKVWSAVERLQASDARFEIEAPNAVAGVRGTVFAVGFSPDEQSTRVAVVAGEVGVSSMKADGYVLLKANMATTVVANRPPVPPQVLDEREKQEWDRWREAIPFSEIGIVGGIAEINAMQAQDAARIVRELSIAKKGGEKVAQDFTAIESAMLLYYADVGVLPAKLKDLMENPGRAGWKGPYLGVGTTFMDPYGRPYQYRIKQTPRGKRYAELSTFGLIGAAGETRGQEAKAVYEEKLAEEAKKRLAGPPD